MDNNDGSEPPRSRSSKTLFRNPTLPMKFFIDTRKLDPETAAMLQEYDQDGDGVFSKEEVVAIVIELRKRSKVNTELRQWNLFYRRMTILMSIVFVVLLLGFLGLSVAVSAMTTKVDIDDSDTTAILVSHSDPTTIIVTNSRSAVFTLDASTTTTITNNDDENTVIYCISETTANSIFSMTSLGRTVSLELINNNDNNHHQVVQLSAAMVGQDPTSGKTTYGISGSESRVLCIQPNEDCNQMSDGQDPYGVSWLSSSSSSSSLTDPQEQTGEDL